MKVALIIARKNSQRIKNKNRKKFFKKPIIYWPIKTLIASNIFDKVYVSTDDKLIAKLAQNYGAIVPFIRSKKLSGHTVSTIDVVKNFIKKIDKKYNKVSMVCCAYGASPFFNIKDLKEADEKIKNKKNDFIFIATKVNQMFLRSFYFSENKIQMVQKNKTETRSQDLPYCYIDAGQFYFAKKQNWIKSKTIFTPNSTALIRKKEDYVDINTSKDFELAQKIFKKRKIYKKIEIFDLVKFRSKHTKMIFNWRNESRVRQNSLNSKKISIYEHKQWVKNISRSNKNKIFIFTKDNIGVGNCSLIKSRDKYYFNYLISRKFRGKGYSKIMLRLFFNKIKNLNLYKVIYALVAKKNKISYNVLSYHNFKTIRKAKKFYELKLNI